MRLDVTLLALAIYLLLIIPSLVIADVTSNYWIIIVSTIPTFLVTILMMNKLLTGKFTNKGKFWFDEEEKKQ